ncbi:uncharacterized protein LOC114543922 [Dendronephthya gigantea]|nr:uncharacterized protein LOC114543922 [Dendronephthya gigantea]
MQSSLTNKRLIKGIKHASPMDQTSCLEGFHSVLNQFSPKMIGYTYRGMFCRHALAVMHFNQNLSREARLKNGVEQYNVVYPKFMNGEAVVRKVPVKQNFDYVDKIYQTMLEAIANKKLEDAIDDLNEKTPPPMNTMLSKQSREEAIQKKKTRDAMQLSDVPPTNPVPTVEVGTQSHALKQRNAPKCRLCKQPMKGHKNVVDCPKNKKD